MSRWLLLLVLPAACGNNVDGNLVWSWSFQDPATGKDVACPAGVDQVRISVRKNINVDTGPTTAPAGGDTFACSAGIGGVTIVDNPDTGPPSYSTGIDALTSDGRIYARSARSSVSLPAGGATQHLHEDITTGRGYLQLSWTVVGQSSMAPVDCTNYAIDTLYGPGEAFTFLCQDGTGILPGLPPGAYDLQLTARTALYPSGPILASATVAAQTITPDATTDVAITLIAPGH